MHNHKHLLHKKNSHEHLEVVAKYQTQKRRSQAHKTQGHSHFEINYTGDT